MISNSWKTQAAPCNRRICLINSLLSGLELITTMSHRDRTSKWGGGWGVMVTYRYQWRNIWFQPLCLSSTASLARSLSPSLPHLSSPSIHPLIREFIYPATLHSRYHTIHFYTVLIMNTAALCYCRTVCNIAIHRTAIYWALTAFTIMYICCRMQ